MDTVPYRLKQNQPIQDGSKRRRTCQKHESVEAEMQDLANIRSSSNDKLTNNRDSNRHGKLNIFHE